MNDTATRQEPTPLSTMLREVSLKGHSGDDWDGGEAEAPREPQYATAFLRGGLNRDGIAAQFAQHFLMYEALERATDAQLRLRGSDFAFAMPELRRIPALKRDLEHWIGDDWERRVRDRYATEGILAYAQRIRETAETSLPRFVAHHYTRYLADLSGGLMIAEMFRDSYGIDGDDGVRFYIFDEIEDPKTYKHRYRALLDALDFEETERRACADEVALAYALNNRAGADLEAGFEGYRA